MKNIEELPTTISISRKNHERLMELGKKGDTFDEILSTVLKQTTRKKATVSVKTGIDDK